MARRGLIDAVEACWSLDWPDRRAWLENVLAHVAAAVAEERGGMAYHYDTAGPPDRWTIERPIVIDAPEDIARATESGFADSPKDLLLRLYKHSGPVTTFVQAAGVSLTGMPMARARATAHRLDMTNLAILNAANPDGHGTAFAFVTSADKRLSARTHPHLAQLAAHVAAADRLMRALSTSREVAVFEPSGKPAHLADGDAVTFRSELRDAVGRLDRARGRLRRSDEKEALATWRALVAGRWSLVDRFESDGRRYVIVHENAPDMDDPRALSPDERIIAGLVAHGHADKVIAYELGRPEGTVRAASSTILRKLGLRSRVDLVLAMMTPDRLIDVPTDGGQPVRALAWPVGARAGVLDSLTAAERDVASLAASGKSNADIAGRRGTSARTIANQLARIFAKLEVRSRAELARRLG